MSSNRFRLPKQLKDAEIYAILKAAESLHNASTRTRLWAHCDHSKALNKINAAVIALAKDLTGEETPPWIGYGTTTPSKWHRLGL